MAIIGYKNHRKNQERNHNLRKDEEELEAVEEANAKRQQKSWENARKRGKSKRP